MHQNRCAVVIISAALLGMAFVGCHRRETATISPPAFAGAWNGPWMTAAENGTLAIRVAPGGTFTGTLIDVTQNVTTPITGVIAQGVLKGNFVMKGSPFTIRGPVSVSEEGQLTGAVESYRGIKHSAHATLKLSRSVGPG